jgi:hypothetical protein
MVPAPSVGPMGPLSQSGGSQGPNTCACGHVAAPRGWFARPSRADRPADPTVPPATKVWTASAPTGADPAGADPSDMAADAHADAHADARCAGCIRSGARRVRTDPVTTPVEPQAGFAACDATFGADEPADPSRRTRHEPEHVVCRPDTGGWLQAPQQELGRRIGPGSTLVQASSPRRAGRFVHRWKAARPRTRPTRVPGPGPPADGPGRRGRRTRPT